MSCGHRIEPNEDVLDYWRRIGNMPCKRNPLMSDLITQHGSFRRLIEAYWLGRLTAREERQLEDTTPKELIASFKPVVVEVQNYGPSTAAIQ